MKFIGIYKSTPENMKVAAKKRAELPEFKIKSISEAYTFLGKTSGFQILEVDDERELEKLALYYMPEVEFKFKPIIELDQVIKLIS